MINTKDIAALVLLFFLQSCSSSSWHLEENNSQLQEYSSSRLIYKPDYSYYGLELEIINLSGEVHLFINATTLKFPEIPKNSSQTPLTITILDQPITFECHLHKGQNRILLSKEATSMIIDGLNNKNPVHITISDEEAVIEPKDEFHKQYQHLMGNSSFWEKFLF